MQLCLNDFPRYFPITILTYSLKYNRTIMGVGKVRKFCAHVEIIEMNLMEFIAKC